MRKAQIYIKETIKPKNYTEAGGWWCRHSIGGFSSPVGGCTNITGWEQAMFSR